MKYLFNEQKRFRVGWQHLLTDLYWLYHMGHVPANHCLHHRQRNSINYCWTGKARGCKTQEMLVLSPHTSVKPV